ncbi:MAG TPA: FAD binding domain-containing protein [Streptosporangiaceae bacterium]
MPAYVEYEKATSLEHALNLLTRFGPEAKVLAGGHSLIPMMKLRLAQPETLIDINGLTELSYVEVTDGELRIGAMTRHAQLLDSAAAGQHFAILHDAERVIADPIVRLWGTVGGSLCQADPSEDLSAAFAALKATMVIHGLAGTRRYRPGTSTPGRTRQSSAPARSLPSSGSRSSPAAEAPIRRWDAGSATGRSPRPGRRSGWTPTAAPSPTRESD